MNIVLCGMMGCGKTTVGALLAKTLGWEWIDTDELIISRHGNIANIFKEKGEDYFRDLERQIVAEIAQKDRLVLSTGGGLVCSNESVALLKNNGKIVYLRAKKKTLISRLCAGEGRPLVQGGEGLDNKLTQRLVARACGYEGVADSVVDVEGKAPEEIVREILAKIEQ